MPSCVIEYTSGISSIVPASQLVSAVHQAAIDSSLFTVADIKTRAFSCDNYLVGEGRAECVHVTLSIMPGRSEANKQALSAQVLSALKSILQEKSQPGLSLTVQVKEIDRQSYSKFVF